MLPHEVHPGWYDAYWLSDRPHPKRTSLARSFARFAVLVVLLASSGLALSYFAVQNDPGGGQDWEQE